MSQVFNVNGFKTALVNGGARPNQFQVILTGPPGSPGLIDPDSPYLISVAELPGQTINPAIVQYRGREVKFAGDRVYAPWTITVLNDTDFKLRKGIERWMDFIEGYTTKVGQLDPGLYQADFTVEQLDRNGEVLKRYRLESAFPVDLSPIALDFGANDQISTFTCTWQYQAFVPVDPNSGEF